MVSSSMPQILEAVIGRSLSRASSASMPLVGLDIGAVFQSFRQNDTDIRLFISTTSVPGNRQVNIGTNSIQTRGSTTISGNLRFSIASSGASR